MGKKKSCICGYWNAAQQECLYSGPGCARDDQTSQVTEEWIGEKAGELTRLSSHLPKLRESEYKLEFNKAKDFIRSLVEEIRGK